MVDWKSVVGTVAPWIGAALGGPLGSAAVGAVADALGLSDKTEESIKQALAGVTPEQMLALKNADQAFALNMQEIGFNNIKDMESIAASDRDSARKREIAVKDSTPARLAYMIIGGFMAISIAQLWALMGYAEVAAKIPPQGWLLIGNISGYLAAEAKAAASYYFGTTTDSGRKTELLAKSPAIQE